MKRQACALAMSIGLTYTAPTLAAACLDDGKSLSPAQTQTTMTVISNLIHPHDDNTIKYVRECFTLPLSNCQMAVDLVMHVSGSDPTPHMTWRIGKANEGIYSSPVRTLHIFQVGAQYGFTAFDTGKGNMDDPCE